MHGGGVHAAVRLSLPAAPAALWGCGSHLCWSPLKLAQAVARWSPLKNILSRDISVMSFSFELQAEHQLVNKVLKFV